MRNVCTSMALVLMAVSVTACSTFSNDATPYHLGTRDDIIVNNRGDVKAPAADIALADAAKNKIETVKMESAQTAGDGEAVAQKQAMEKVIAEANANNAVNAPAPQPVGAKAKIDSIMKADAAAQPVAAPAATAPAAVAPVMPAAAPVPAPTVAAAPMPTPICQPMGTIAMKGEHPEQVAATPAAQPPANLSGDIPPNAKPGECYAKVLIPAVTQAQSEQVKVSEEQEVLARIVAPRYEVRTEKVLVKEARQYWKKGEGPIQRVDEATGEILCLVEEPAVYKTIEKRVLVEPEKPEYKKIPAQYENVTKTVVLKPERMEWRRILCETNVTPSTIARLQTALQSKGFDVGPIDGQPGAKTMNALARYQTQNGLARGITYETLEHLGITPAGA